MNVHLLLGLLWSLETWIFGTATFPALTVLYSVETKEYFLSDLKQIEEMKYFSKSKAPYRILQCCPASENEIADEFLDDPEIEKVFIIKGIFSSIQESAQITCSGSYEPTLFSVGNGSSGFSITFKIFNDRVSDPIFKGSFSEYEIKWIDVATIYFDADKIEIHGSKHNVFPNPNAIGEPSQCKDFFFAHDTFEEIPFDYFYGEANQEEVFKNLVKPKNQLLVPHQLVPIDDFRTTVARKSTCTYLNVTPIWKSISEGALKKVENYIREVANDLKGITVFTATKDVLSLRDAVGTSSFTYSQVYLMNNIEAEVRQLPVPRLLCKLVTYNEVPLIVGIIIVIHNDFVKHENNQRLCEEDVCEKYGWSVANPDPDIDNPLVYCCEPKDELLSQFQLADFPKGLALFDLAFLGRKLGKSGFLQNFFNDLNFKIFQKKN